MNRPIMPSTPGRESGRPEMVVPNTTSRRSVSRPNTTAQAYWTTVFTVSPWVRAHDVRLAVSDRSIWTLVRRGTESGWAPRPSASITGPRNGAR